MAQICSIRNEESYNAALAEVERHFEAEPAAGTPEADRFAVMLDLIAAYEARRWPIGGGDPVAVLAGVMEMTGRTQRDLAALVGSRPRASEIINRKRRLTLGQVRRISQAWNIPADALIAHYDLSA